MRITRRGLQLALAGFWLLDGVLQCQPYMFTRSFPVEVLGASGDGQPGFVAAPIHLVVDAVAAHPVPWNAAFAVAQLAIGAALIWRRSARIALGASVLWSIGVWGIGEGFGGLFSGHGMLLTGAPGAVVLYALIAVAAWPTHGVGREEPPSAFAIASWVGVWMLGALLQVLPGQNTPSALTDAVAGPDSPTPTWLQGAGHALAHGAGRGYGPVVALVMLQAFVAAFALVRGAPRRAALIAGSAIAIGSWLFGQGLGELLTGKSTDPNSAPLLILLAAAAWSARRRPMLARSLSRNKSTWAPEPALS